MTNAGLGTAKARELMDVTSGTGAARTLLTEANASAAKTDSIMRGAENMTKRNQGKKRGIKVVIKEEEK